MKLIQHAEILLLLGLMAVTSGAQTTGNLTGSFPVEESYSVTIQLGTGSSVATHTYSGQLSGTLVISNGQYTLINRTGAATLPRANRTIDYDSFGGDYYVGGTEVGIGSGSGEFFVEVPLTFFAIKIAIGSQGGFSLGGPGSSSFSASGTTLGDLLGSGTFVDGNAPDNSVGYVNEVDWSSTAGIVFPPVAPTITSPPFNQAVSPGQIASFTVAATGTPTPSFQWKHNGAAVGNSGRFSGANTPALTISDAQTSDAGTYTVEVSNSKGSVSAAATLTVYQGQVFTNLYNFQGTTGGGTPIAGPLLSGATLFGAASGGGSNNEGTVFSVNLSPSTFADLHDFAKVSTNASSLQTNLDGTDPTSGLTLAGGVLYGTAQSGGKAGHGTLFSLSQDGSNFTNLYEFSQTETNSEGFMTNGDGSGPVGPLVQAGGTLFGVAFSGGSAGFGAVYSIDTNGTGFTTLYAFTNGTDGASPYAGLTLVGNTLYGTTQSGGASGDGTVFSLTTDGSVFATLYNFSQTDTNGFNSDGSEPETALVFAGGRLYGTTSSGGTGGNGVVFGLNTADGGFQTLHDFSAPANNLDFSYVVTNADGAFPGNGLALAGGTLYGIAESGGANGNGTIFSVNTNGNGFSVLYTFSATDANGFNSDGASPNLVGLSGNTLYGTATYGGLDGLGTIFGMSLSAPSGSSPAPQGSLEVTLAPAAAATAGAQWRVDGGAYHASGATVTNLAASSNHVVSFKPAPGFQTPATQTIGVTNNLTTDITGNYFDTNPPTVTIVSPTTGQRLSNGVFTVTGTAGDNVAVSAVYTQLNGQGWTLAGTTNSFARWTNTLTLSPGSNRLQAYAMDSSGNPSPTKTVGFLYITTAPLTVLTNGLGGITPEDNAKLLAIGSNYTLTASPAKNWLFSNWVASGSESFVSNNPVLKFTMQSNLVLTADFVTNLFLAAQGSYHGLFAPTGVVREETNSGAFVLNLLSTGAFTGDLFLGSNTVSLAGKFNVGGYVQTNSTVKGGRPLTTTLQLDVANQAISGMVSDGSFTAQLDGDQNVFGPAHPATEYAGQYTWTIPGTNNPLVGPYGTSYGTVTVNPNGDITFAGSLADGTTVSQSSAVSQDGRWPMFLPSSNPNESVYGWNYFTNQTLTAPASVSWISLTNKARSALYSSGFTNQEAALVASYYNPATKPLLSLTEAQVTLQGGGLPFGITNQITLAANNTVGVPTTAGNTNHLKLTITPKTGAITGSFQNPANARQTITINGVLLQNQTNAQGYFLGTNQSGTFLLDNQ